MNQNQSLAVELRKALNEVETQIDILKQEAERAIYLGPPPHPTWQNMKNTDGSYPAIALITAKANLLLAIATLRTAK